MKFGSVCSGIEAASVAWDSLGWRAEWFAEIEAFPSAVLNYHFPSVPNLGDMTLIAEQVANDNVPAPDVLVGGTPCQAFSVAGARKSLDDERGQLSLEFIKLANSIDEKRIKKNEQPSIIVWENVPGVLNTKDNAFGCFLGALAGESSELVPTGERWGNAGCVFGPQRAIAWRILDAQYFGVAQRRRRVFVVASARKGFYPHKVLFEWEGVRRDIAPSRSAGQEIAGSAGKGFAESNRVVGALCMSDHKGVGNQYVSDGKLVIHGTQDPIANDNLAFPLGRNSGQENAVFSIQGNMIGRSDNAGPQGSGVSDDISFTLTKGDRHGVYCGTQNDACRDVGREIAPTLRAGNGGGAVNQVVNQSLVRRLTPRECERLQGFPDDWTKIPYRKKSADDCPDGPRYAACGNSMAVPVMAWIGKRIAENA